MTLLDLLYPKRCPICLETLPPGDRLICAPCARKVRRVSGPLCYRCGKPLPDPALEYCSGCRKRMPLFEENAAWGDYRSWSLRRMIARVKYHGEPQLLDYPCLDMAERLSEKVAEWSAEVLIPVPVHGSRLKKRGYNQAAEIAVRLGRAWNLPVDENYLVRREKTAAQKELHATERMLNLMNAFRAAGAHGKYESVILTDDIYTTGSTLNACTAALLAAGVKHVHAVTLLIGRDTQ